MQIDVYVPPKVWQKSKRLGVKRKLEKAVKLFRSNWRHPSLKTELLYPKKMGIWSLRVDKKVRALFFWREDKKRIEVFALTVHYR